jgi:RNA recognition motif-containing protein
MNTKLYVSNLSFDTTEETLRTAFAPFGSVTDVFIATDRETGRPRGFAFVTFAAPAESQAAIMKMNGTELDGRVLSVAEARPKEDAGGRSFGPDRKAGAFQQRNKRRY